MCGFQGTRNRREKRDCAEGSQDGSPGYKVTGRKPGEQRPAQTLQGIPVTMAKGIHLFPYRTQKLSLSAPMVLGWRRPGRVGRCRIPKRNQPHECGVDFFLGLIKTWLSGLFPAKVHTSYLARFSLGGVQWTQNSQGKTPGRANVVCFLL